MNIKINNISAEQIGESLEIKGRIIKVDDSTPLIIKGFYKCLDCMATYEVTNKKLEHNTKPEMCLDCGSNNIKFMPNQSKYIDSQKAYIDSAGDPCVATVPEALRHDADGNKFIWWFPTEIRDAYGNIINDAKNFTLNEQYRPIMELSKWTAAADDKTRTAWDFKPIYATTYTVYLDSRLTARTEETNSYNYQFTARRGDPVTLKDYFPRLDDSRFKFLNYNTDYSGTKKV